MKSLAVAMGAALALSACAGNVNVTSAGSDGVTVRHAAGYESYASAEANDQCNVFGKKARLRSSHSEGGDRFAIYDCVPM